MELNLRQIWRGKGRERDRDQCSETDVDRPAYVEEVKWKNEKGEY